MPTKGGGGRNTLEAWKHTVVGWGMGTGVVVLWLPLTIRIHMCCGLPPLPGDQDTCAVGAPGYQDTCAVGAPGYQDTCAVGPPGYQDTCAVGAPGYQDTCAVGAPGYQDTSAVGAPGYHVLRVPLATRIRG
jgi:hypothetical protein